MFFIKYTQTPKVNYDKINVIAARNQAAFEEEEPGVAEEADEEGGQDGQKLDFDDKMGAKVRAYLLG